MKEQEVCLSLLLGPGMYVVVVEDTSRSSMHANKLYLHTEEHLRSTSFGKFSFSPKGGNPLYVPADSSLVEVPDSFFSF